MSDSDTNEVQGGRGGIGAAIQAGRELGLTLGRVIVNPANDDLYTLVPDWAGLQRIHGEADEATPRRKRASVEFAEVDSLIRYVNDHKTPTTALFATVREDGGSIRAVLDYHGKADQPCWGDHAAVCGLPFSAEWKRWIGRDNSQFAQTEFAEWLENNGADVVEPAGAALLEMARFFTATQGATFRSRTDLRTGEVQFRYEETIAEAVGQRAAETQLANTQPLPGEFVLGLTVFQNGQPYRVPARLRYRLNSGKLRFEYHIDRPHRFVQDAIRDAMKLVKEKTGFDPYVGVVTRMSGS